MSRIDYKPALKRSLYLLSPILFPIEQHLQPATDEHNDSLQR
jgi:hypothetical protein